MTPRAGQHAGAPEGLTAYLAALCGSAPAGQLLELRYRRPGRRMRQRFFDVKRARSAAAAIAVLGSHHEVYVGVALRARRKGSREAIRAGWALWADCDGEAAATALATFEPAAAIVVRTGSGRNRHGYWPLTTPLTPARLERANRRLALALGADPASTDPARILRVPGSRNYKHSPPRPVALERFTGERFEITSLLAQLPELPQPAARPPAAPSSSDDPLRAIDPAVYVRALTGRTPGRDRKVACSLHEDSTPSLHVYDTPQAGWYCFGC